MTSSGRMYSSVGTSFYRAPECHTPNQEHGLSVDIWAIGMLTLQLLAGQYELPIIYETTLSSQHKIDDYIKTAFDLMSQDMSVSNDAKDFVRYCLAHDTDKRPTAVQAFKHRCFQEPKKDRKLFKSLEKEVLSTWSPRGIVLPIIEDLTAKSAELSVGGQQHYEVSPYFEVSRQILPPRVCNAIQPPRDTQMEACGSSHSSQRTLVEEDGDRPSSNQNEIPQKRGGGYGEGISTKWPKYDSC
ncbi:kinase-like domain-containing protein [Cercophora newfieldiana]|uniref:Kinase-like domain-containing protein n=1 Tax=Cercophora newfieldiana TaxID=92897 RepID=A0AA39Y565_9PEZI|nr:kinase-like domain-containing protein [Cercophora newfieldiana]